MKIAKFQRVAAFILAFVLLIGGGTFAASANSNEEDSSVITNIGDIKELLSAISYNDYITENANVDRAKAPIRIEGATGVYTSTNGKEVELINKDILPQLDSSGVSRL